MNIETSTFIRGMEKAGRIAAETLVYASKFARPGMTTNEIDQIVHEYTLSRGAIPAPLNYHGFPKSVCTSVNEVVCHGLPNQTVLKNGDIINIDVTSIVDGYFGDTSATYFVGDVSENAKKLTLCAEQARSAGIAEIRPHGTTGDIGFATNKLVTRAGYYVVRDIGGHGIGLKFHMEPFVPAFGKKGKGEILKPWQCITVEPMVNETAAELVEHDVPNSSIKWYTTADKTLSAQFEHTVLVTDTGHVILTVC